MTDSRITAVGPTGQVKVPAGARVIEVAGKTIVSENGDVHAHTRPRTKVHTTAVPTFHARLAFGVTTMRDPHTQMRAR